MKKIIYALLILPVVFSCVLYSIPALGETNFPLKQIATIPVGGVIEDIAIADTWIAIHTHDDKIIAIDIDTQEILWSIDFSVNAYGVGVEIVNNLLIAASQDQITMVDKQGHEKQITLALLNETFPSSINIVKVVSVYPNYLYVVRGSNWTLEVYDISTNAMLWKKRVGRGIGNIFYDPLNNLAYITINNTIYAFDNLTGKISWEITGSSGRYFEDDILYTRTDSNSKDGENLYEVNAIDVKTQTKLWSKNLTLSPNGYVGALKTIDNLLVISGDGMRAIDKSSGEEIWGIGMQSIGEEFSTVPVEFNGVIYAMGGSSNTVFAISADDGSIIGTANLENDNSHRGIYAIKDGILVNTSNSVVIYKAK